MTATDYMAERDRLAELQLWNERAGEAVRATVAALRCYLDSHERLADWRAAATALRQPTPQDARQDFTAAFMALTGSLFRLRDSAQQVQGLCRGLADDGLARWCRGALALAQAIGAGVHRDGAAGELADHTIDLERVAAIVEGLNLLEMRIGQATALDARTCLRHHEREVAYWRRLGQHRLAEQLGGDPDIVRALTALREVAGEEP